MQPDAKKSSYPIIKTKEKSKKIKQPFLNGRTSWLTNIMRKPSYLLLIGIASAIGGFPGIFQLINYFKADTDFYYTPRTGEIVIFPSNSDSNITFVLLNGTFANYGKEPLLVAGFDLKIDYSDKEVYCDRDALPNWNILTSPEMTVNFDSLKKFDISQTKVINVNDPIIGSLLFQTNIKYSDFMKVDHRTYEVSCTDLKGIQHTRKFDAFKQDINESTAYPETGLSIEKEKRN